MHKHEISKPKIALIVSSGGVESISVLPGQQQGTRAGCYDLCSHLADEIEQFDISVKRKFGFVERTNN